MRLKEALEPMMEGISDIVFHSTNIDSAINILKSDSIALSFSSKTAIEYDFGGGRAFFLSTSRSKMGVFASAKDITLHLNGRALSRNFAGRPVDYFGGDTFTDEMEDRIVTNKPTIDNFSKYITRIDVSVRSAGGLISGSAAKSILEMVRLAR